MRTPFYIRIVTLPIDEEKRGEMPLSRWAKSAGMDYDEGTDPSEEMAAWKEQEFERTAMNPAYGRLYGVALAIGDHPPTFVCKERERETLESVWRLYAKAGGVAEAVIVGHNVLDFDLYFLTRRSLILGVQFPPELFVPKRYDSGEGLYFDTYLQWSGGRTRRGSLDDISYALKANGTERIGENEVWDLYQQGKYDLIRDEAMHRVEVVRGIQRKMMPLFEFAMTPKKKPWAKSGGGGTPGWKPPKLSGTMCPDCGKPMAIREGKNGEFLGCTGYKDGCKKTLPMPVKPA